MTSEPVPALVRVERGAKRFAISRHEHIDC